MKTFFAKFHKSSRNSPIYLLKKSLCKWICTVQTCIVQGSTECFKMHCISPHRVGNLITYLCVGFSSFLVLFPWFLPPSLRSFHNKLPFFHLWFQALLSGECRLGHSRKASNKIIAKKYCVLPMY